MLLPTALLLATAGQVLATVQTYTWTGFDQYDTPHYFPTSNYRVYPRKTDFSVASVNYWGKVNDFDAESEGSSSYVTARRAPLTFCAIGNNSFWFTGYQSSDELIVPTAFAVGRSSSHPSWVSDYTGFDPSSLEYFIPESPEETANDAQFTKLALPHTACVPISSTRAIQFWDSWADFNSRGSFMVQYDLTVSNNSLTVTRFKDLYGSVDDNQYAYGLFAAMHAKNGVYMYALDTSDYGNSQALFVAFAPADTVTDQSTWKYWKNSTQSWTSTEPLATENRTADAIYTLSGSDQFVIDNTDASMFYAGGSIFYSEYHHAYLMVYVSTADTTSYIIEYAPTPVGPWSNNKKVLYTDSTNNLKAALVTPMMFSTPSLAGNVGKYLLMTPASPDSEYDGLTYKLIFD